jgi:hypothetical protein
MEEPDEAVKKDKRKPEDNEGERDRKRFKDEAQQLKAGNGSGNSNDLETDVSVQLLRISVDIAEMYSPLRVTKEGGKVGEATDLTNGMGLQERGGPEARHGLHRPVPTQASHREPDERDVRYPTAFVEVDRRKTAEMV